MINLNCFYYYLLKFKVKDLVANLVLSNSTQKLLLINNIGFNTTIDIDSNSDCKLDIGILLFNFYNNYQGSISAILLHICRMFICTYLFIFIYF